MAYWGMIQFPARAGNFSCWHDIETDCGAHLVPCPVGTGRSFSKGWGLKQPGCEAVTTLSGAVVKNVWGLIKQRIHLCGMGLS
jgi:hypothetical protein